MIKSKIALCIGINNFKNYPDAKLNGCINDATNMKNMLEKCYGFSNIILLTDKKATKANIIKNLNNVISDALSYKYSHIVFSFSSHGTQIFDNNKDESDGLDEAFCTYDLIETNNDWDKNHILLDDELHEAFDHLPSGVRVEIFLDTCHSGTGIRSIDRLLTRKLKYIPPISLKMFNKLDNKTPNGYIKKFKALDANNQILWASCKNNQTSADAYINNSWNGAFTYYLYNEIMNNKTIKRSDLLKKIKSNLKLGQYSQIPQLECVSSLGKESVLF